MSFQFSQYRAKLKHVKFLILIVYIPFPLQTTCLEVPHSHIQITFGWAAIRASLRKQNRVYFSYQLNLLWCSQPSSKDIPVKPGLVKNPCKVWGWCPQMHVYGGFLKHQSLQVYQILSRMGTVPFKILDWFTRLFFRLELCSSQLPWCKVKGSINILACASYVYVVHWT